MARLTNCKDCGHEVSKKAKTCPSCGAPLKKSPRQYGCFSVIVLGVLVLFAVAQFSDTGNRTSSHPQPAATPKPAPTGETYWVTSDRLNRRTCPSTSCGVVGQLLYRERAGVMEQKNGWARVSKYYQAACENGRSRFVDSGNAACTAENGINGGQFAEWVAMSSLNTTRPADPAAGATGAEKLVAGSDDYRIHKDAFVRAANQLLKDGRCKAKDFEDNGGWAKSTSAGNKPVYFIYCGGFTNANRLYLDAASGRIYK